MEPVQAIRVGRIVLHQRTVQLRSEIRISIVAVSGSHVWMCGRLFLLWQVIIAHVLVINRIFVLLAGIQFVV